MQSRTSLAALMTASLALAAPLVFTQIDAGWAQSGGGGGSGGSAGSSGAGGTGASGGGTAGAGTTGSGATGSGSVGSTGSGAGDRGGSGTGRTMGDTTRPGATTSGPGMSNTQPGAMDRDSSRRGMTNRDSTGSSMQGSSGTDATTRGASGSVRGTDETSGLVGTEKRNAALGALEGTAGNRTRRGASSPRVVQMEEYETAMRNALAVEDPAQRSAAVAEARERLQRATNRQVSADVIARVDSILGLPATATTR